MNFEDVCTCQHCIVAQGVENESSFRSPRCVSQEQLWDAFSRPTRSPGSTPQPAVLKPLFLGTEALVGKARLHSQCMSNLVYNRRLTCADVVPVGVVGGQLLESGSLHDVHPARQLDLPDKNMGHWGWRNVRCSRELAGHSIPTACWPAQSLLLYCLPDDISTNTLAGLQLYAHLVIRFQVLCIRFDELLRRHISHVARWGSRRHGGAYAPTMI